MMCLGESRDKEPVAPCLGVPGAPLVLRGNLLGILSWGLGCGYAHDLPLIYTDIKYYSPWLVENVSLLRNITQRSIREIFLATKAVKLSDWLSKTRLNKPLSRPDLWINDLQSLEIDNDLSRLEGTVYDIRDFLNRGIHHSEKNNIYKDIQEKHNISEQHHNISYVIKTEPFLSNNSVYNLNTDNDGESDNDD
ncbi:unnamed protein product [Leptosia nina]|uniref:Peptidase S1 domain-containing protein n=1 Tax=Leptosia nina TaxID=320188 RepID=A0AAV1JXD7_9NEOP